MKPAVTSTSKQTRAFMGQVFLKAQTCEFWKVLSSLLRITVPNILPKERSVWQMRQNTHDCANRGDCAGQEVVAASFKIHNFIGLPLELL